MTNEASGYRRAIAPLALGTFAVGTEGLAVAGILPEIFALEAGMKAAEGASHRNPHASG